MFAHNTMGFTGPKHIGGFVVAIIMAVFCICMLGNSGYLCNVGVCRAGTPFGLYYGAAALGITAGVFGMLCGIACIFFHLVDEMWQSGIARGALTITSIVVCVLMFVSMGLYIGGVVSEVDALEGRLGITFGIIAGVASLLEAIFISTSHGAGCCGCFSPAY